MSTNVKVLRFTAQNFKEISAIKDEVLHPVIANCTRKFVSMEVYNASEPYIYACKLTYIEISEQ